MSESYLPRPALDWWVEQGEGREKTLRRKRVEAFFQMPASLRRRFDMKKGFLWGLSKERRNELSSSRQCVTEGELYKHFPDATEVEKAHLRSLLAKDNKATLYVLQNGFGDDIGKLWTEPKLDGSALSSWMDQEVPREERLSVIQSILDRL